MIDMGAWRAIEQAKCYYCTGITGMSCSCETDCGKKGCPMPLREDNYEAWREIKCPTFR